MEWPNTHAHIYKDTHTHTHKTKEGGEWVGKKGKRKKRKKRKGKKKKGEKRKEVGGMVCREIEERGY